MGSFGLGFTTYMGLGEESSYGTAVARDVFYDLEGESLSSEHRRIEAANLNQIGIRKNRIADGSERYSGNTTMHAIYTAQGRLWKHALGSVQTQANTTSPGGGAGSLYNHTFQISDALPTGLTMEIFRDTSNFYTPGGDVNKAFVYRGCKIGSITVSAELDAFVSLDVAWIAQDMNRLAKTAAATVMADLDDTRNPLVFTQGTLYYGPDTFHYDIDDATPEGIDSTSIQGAIAVESFEVSLNNNLEDDRGTLGSRLIREPVRADGKIEVTGSFTCDFNSFREYDDFMSSTTKTLALVCTQGSISANGSWERLQFIFHDIVPTGDAINVDGEGPITQEIEFKAYRSVVAAGATDATPYAGGTNSTGEMVVVLTNAESSI